MAGQVAERPSQRGAASHAWCGVPQTPDDLIWQVAVQHASRVGSHCGFEKNCTVKEVLGELSSVPCTRVTPPEVDMAEITG